MTRTTITLDDDLVRRAKHFVPDRGLNGFFVEAIAEKVGALERANLEAAMREGYLAERDHPNEDIAEWERVEVEGWPE